MTNHPATVGLGYLDHPKLMGLKVHSTLVATTSGVPLGLIDQQIWQRDLENLGIAKQRRQRQTEEKESQRWLLGLSTAQQIIPTQTQVVTVTDSEGDIYDLFTHSRPDNSHLLIRGTHNRRVNHDSKYLHEAIRATQTCGQMSVEIKRNPENQARTATLTLRFATLEIQPPLHHKQRSNLKPVSI